MLGGDGTILTALREYAGTSVPVFAVNYGEVGFLATLDPDGLGRDFDRAFGGEFEILQLPTIDVGRPQNVWTAINDISVHRKPGMRVADLSYGLAGEEIGRVRCDGLVVATPQGSTGENLANGGPILAWGVRGYVVCFIAPHSLTARALVVAPTTADDQQREPRGGGRGPRRRPPRLRAPGRGGHPRRVRALLRERPAPGRELPPPPARALRPAAKKSQRRGVADYDRPRMSGAAREHPSAAPEAEPAALERSGLPARPGDLLALARSLQSSAGTAAVQRLAAIARAPVAAPAAYETVAELLAAIGGPEEKPPYTSAKYQRAVEFLAVAGYDQMQEAFRGLEQRGGSPAVDCSVRRAGGLERIRLAMLAWKDRRRTSRVMFEIEHRSELAALSAADRDVFLEWISLEWGEVVQMKAAKGFQALSQADQDRLLVDAGGSLSVSSGVPGQLQTLFGDPKANLDEAATFTKFLHAQAGLDSNGGPLRTRGCPTGRSWRGRPRSRSSSSAPARPTRCATRRPSAPSPRARSRSTCRRRSTPPRASTSRPSARSSS